MSDHEERVPGLIERHGKVAFRLQGPPCYSPGAAIDDRHLIQVREIDINIGTGRFQLKRLWMRPKFVFLLQTLVRRGIDYRNSASLIVAVSNVHNFLHGVVTKIVDIISKIDGCDQFEGIAVVDVELAFVAAHKELVRCGGVNDPLRPGHTDAMNDPSGPEVDRFFAIVAQGGNEEAAFVIDSEMVDASLHVGQRHSASQD
jgi:hypothetical protein